MHSGLYRASRLFVWVLLGLSLSRCALLQPRPAPPVDWKDFGYAAFEEARQESRLVLLNVEAVWCHWCHVMDERTYADPEVARLLRESFVCIKVDQDSRPDLANRYRRWGWPATIVLDSDGNELLKRAGYIAATPLMELLQRVLRDPSDSTTASFEFSVPQSAMIDAGLMAHLLQTYRDMYDHEFGGWGFVHKFLQPDPVEMGIRLGLRGSEEDFAMSWETLQRCRSLIDPAWGGMYQYSAARDWEHPHFEKIASTQAHAMRLYAMAHAVDPRSKAKDAADSIFRYIRDFLTSPEGAFYASQDADLVPGDSSQAYFELGADDRSRQGHPPVDRSLYARETAWIAHSLALAYGWTGDRRFLAASQRAAQWIWHSRRRPDGSFSHSDDLDEGPYLGDLSASMATFQALFEVSADRVWLDRAELTAQALDGLFDNVASDGSVAGYRSLSKPDSPLPSVPDRRENIELARTLIRLHHNTGSESYRRQAEQALRWLAIPDVARRGPSAGTWLVGDEMSRDPLRISILGPRDSEAARALFEAALKIPVSYRRIDWWDPALEADRGREIEFPPLAEGAAAAYLGIDGGHSEPFQDPIALRRRVLELLQQ